MRSRIQQIDFPWVEGEKIPDGRAREIFRNPPGVPHEFLRSSLVIGSRGVGKTTLFRYLKETHEETGRGLAIHISLVTEFAGLTKQTNLGPLGYEYPATLEPLVVGKAVSLLALSLVERLSKKQVNPPADALRDCLPDGLVSVTRRGSGGWLGDAKNTVARAPLEKFGMLSQNRPLAALSSALGEASQKLRGELLLLLDRADMVPAVFLTPVIELLDQSASYVALVAMRPGHAGRVIANATPGAAPGDQYGVVHLGTSPYSQEWGDFVIAALDAQFGPGAASSVPSELMQGILALSRDSLKTALELCARCRSSSPGNMTRELRVAIEDLRESQLVAAQQTLQQHHQDFRKLINDIRADIVRKHGTVPGPVRLSVRETQPDDLFRKSDRLDHFIDAALRSSAFSMPHGERWVPGLKPRQIEISPLLLWQKDDRFWPPGQASYTEIDWPEEQLLHVFRGATQPPSVFVAYRMHFPESRRFRTALAEAVASHPSLCRLTVEDGVVPSGTRWADAIRVRIKRSKAVVADITGMRGDVLFEVGFAYGLRKVVIPVVHSQEDRSGLPEWLTATQIGDYASENGILGILSSIAAHLSDPGSAKVDRSPDPVPGLAVWFRVLDWNRHAKDEFEAAAQKEGLKLEVLDEGAGHEVILRRATSAGLLVVSFDGTATDAFCHYICGAIASRPKAGYGARQLPRRILLLTPPAVGSKDLVADSLRRCQDVVEIADISHIGSETRDFGQAYRKWSEGGPAPRRK